MNKLGTTKLSSKGQIVIPEDIRNDMGLHAGDQFLVLAEKDVVILKTIAPPDMDAYRDLVKQARKSAKASGLTKDGLENAIKDARKK